MAHHINGFINKRARLKAAEAKITRPAGRYVETMFFTKGQRRGVLAVWEHRLEWNIYADGQYSMHVDWDDPDSACLNGIPSPCTVLQVIARLLDCGFIYERSIEHLRFA